MHKITLAFSPVLLYIVLRADAVRHFPAVANMPSQSQIGFKQVTWLVARGNKSILHISNGGNENERKSSSCVFRRT